MLGLVVVNEHSLKGTAAPQMFHRVWFIVHDLQVCAWLDYR